MKSQKTLQDYITRKTYWRVLKNTRNLKQKEINKMIKGIFKQQAFYDNEQIVSLQKNKDKSNSWIFNLSDLQQVYGQEVNGEIEWLEKDGYAIGVGDTVVIEGIEYIVFDFLYDEKIRVYKKKNEPFQNTNYFDLRDIKKVIPLNSQTLPMTEEAMIEHLKRVGYKIVK